VGTPIASPFFNPVSLAYDANLVKAYPYDLQRARKMLDDAGIKNLEINTFANAGWPEDKVMLQILQEDWKQINVTLNVTEVQTAQYYDRRYNGDFEMLAWFNARSLRDPYIFFGTQSEVTGRTVPFADPNPNLDKLSAQGAAEVDPEKRKTIYKECNRIVVEEMCNNIWYRTRPAVYGAAKYAKDWSWDTLGHIVFEKAWLDK
jgi:peptide/nickel transport system substrate-binding protein